MLDYLRTRLINDIATDPGAPLDFGDLPPYPAEFAAKQRAAYPAVQPLLLAVPEGRGFELARETAAAMDGWQLVGADPARGLIRAVAVTPLLRFKDDVLIAVRGASGGGSVIQMRSRSRLGKG